MNEPKLERCHIGPWDEVLLDEHGRKCVAILKRQIAELEKENAALRRAPLPDNKALTDSPCWCKDCEYWVPDTDPEDGEQYHRCGNDDSPHGYELTGGRNTCPECKRRPPEKGE